MSTLHVAKLIKTSSPGYGKDSKPFFNRSKYLKKVESENDRNEKPKNSGSVESMTAFVKKLIKLIRYEC